jgi:hypothetical protein
VTVGDVAARAGVRPSEAERALQALAADTMGTLRVAEQGDIVYELSPDFQVCRMRLVKCDSLNALIALLLSDVHGGASLCMMDG